MQRSDSHMRWYVESGGSPSGSRKGFMDKTRVISLCDHGLEIKTNKQTAHENRPQILLGRFFFVGELNVRSMKSNGGVTLSISAQYKIT